MSEIGGFISTLLIPACCAIIVGQWTWNNLEVAVFLWKDIAKLDLAPHVARTIWKVQHACFAIGVGSLTYIAASMLAMLP